MGKAIATAVAETEFVIDRTMATCWSIFPLPTPLAKPDRAVSAGIPIWSAHRSRRWHADGSPKPPAYRVLRAPNTSLGVAVLSDLVERAASVLGPDWDIEIAETHHRMKTDAPSGTAWLLGQAAARGRGTELEPECGRTGTGLKRAPGAIGFASLRGGRLPVITT